LLKIIADENINPRIIKELRSNEFHVISVFDDYRGISDRRVLEIAKNNNALLLTADKDFGILIFAHKEKDVSVIFLRYEYKDIPIISKSLIHVLNKYGDTLYGNFVTITANKVKIRQI